MTTPPAQGEPMACCKCEAYKEINAAQARELADARREAAEIRSSCEANLIRVRKIIGDKKP